MLLQITRKKARQSTSEEAVRERIRCVAFTRILHGDCHWQLAKAYSKLAQAYFTAGKALVTLFSTMSLAFANSTKLRVTYT